MPTGPCALPGSVIWSDSGAALVPGGPASTPDISWMKLAPGFCGHVYTTVGHVRQVKVAPGGELFAASPSQSTAGGGDPGLGQIVVVPDDDKDGFGDSTTAFIDGIAETQGMAFSSDGFFYYQNAATVMRLPYAAGDRVPSSTGRTMLDMATVVPLQPTLHWPKAIDVADDGTLYVANGGEQTDPCETPRPVRGAIVHVDAPTTDNPVGTVVARGLRNPIAIRCNPGKGKCFALELGKDGSGGEGGREKLIDLRDASFNDDWGFPCCAARNLPFTDIPPPAPDCTTVMDETAGFVISDTPFGLDFAPATWPGDFHGAAIVALHGAFGSYVGSRVVAIPTDSTGEPYKSSDLPGATGFVELASGWDDGLQDHGRPAAVGFAPDGRLFLADDTAGLIMWIAPVTY